MAKKVILFIILLVAIGKVQATILTVNTTLQKNKIVLSERHSTTEPEHRSLFKPITLMQYPRYLEATFYGDLGEITIQILDESYSLVYLHTISTSAEQQLYIDVQSFEPGDYFIEFFNSQNQCTYGTFVIQE